MVDLRSILRIPRAWGALRGDKRNTAENAGVFKVAPATLPPVSSDRDGGSFSGLAMMLAAKEVAIAKYEAALKSDRKAAGVAWQELREINHQIMRRRLGWQ